MAQDTTRYGYSGVDDADNPRALVEQMDRLGAQESFQDVKRTNFALLQLPPGAHVLDVGCGPGDDVLALAQLVGSSGRVVGVDSSTTMIEEARRRAEGRGAPVDFQVMDVLHLQFEDDRFDGVRSDRVLQHIEDPPAALMEMVRVTKPGGRVAISDTDWGMFAVDVSNPTLARWLPNIFSGRIRNSLIGRQLFRLFHTAGLEDIQVEPHVVRPGPTMGPPGMSPEDGRAFMMQRAVEAGVVSQDEANAAVKELNERIADGTFFAVLTMFTVAGRKPGQEAPGIEA